MVTQLWSNPKKNWVSMSVTLPNSSANPDTISFFKTQQDNKECENV